MGSEISKIPSAGGQPKAAAAKKAKAQGTKPTENDAVSNKEDNLSKARSQPAAIVELSQKIVKKKALDQVDLTEGDLQRYVSMLKEMPDTFREEKISEAKDKLASGGYGEEEFRVVAEELGRDLGVID